MATGSNDKGTGQHVVCLCVLAVVWILLVVIANPAGNFPLNDDWNYARTVKVLLDEHRLLITQWSLAASLAHIAIGYLVSLVAGFSFEVLRLSSAFLGLIAAVIVYLLCFRVSRQRWLSLMAALVLCLNPLFFNLALTFMTDVPFLAFAALGLIVLLRLFREKASVIDLIVASAVCCIVCLTRQTGLVIPISFAICYSIFSSPASRLKKFLFGLMPLAASSAVIGIFQLWLGHSAGTLYSYRVEEAYLQERFAKGLLFVAGSTLRNLLVAFIYLGLFILPLIPLVGLRFFRSLSKKERFLSVGLAIELTLLVAAGLIVTHSTMPLADNIFYNFGLGPLLLGLGNEAVSQRPNGDYWLLMLLSVMGTIGAGFFTALLVSILDRTRRRTPLVAEQSARITIALCLIGAILYLAIICVRGFFDRYLLFPHLLLLPVIMSAVVFLPESDDLAEAKIGKFNWIVAVVLLVPIAYFAVAGTHDYLAWNRARWQATSELTDKQGISPMDIDGGLEFNGWYAYDPKYRERGVVFSSSMKHNDIYAVTISPVAGYEIIARYPFKRWIPAGVGQILVLKKRQWQKMLHQ